MVYFNYVTTKLFNFCLLIFFYLCCATIYDGEIKLYILFKSTVSCESIFESRVVQSKQFKSVLCKHYEIHLTLCRRLAFPAAAHHLVGLHISSHSRRNRGPYNLAQSSSLDGVKVV